MQRIDTQQLADAFDQRTFFYAYQPIVELSTGKVPYVEALVRWAHPTLGHLQPGSFLSLVHDNGLSGQLTEFSFTEALNALPELRQIYGPDVAVAINLAQRQLADPFATVRLIQSLLQSYDERPESLRIEVVEDLTPDDIRRSADGFAELRSLGLPLVLDDFGTGASSLSALTNMGYDGLKIDHSFTTAMLSNTAARSVIEAVLAFGDKTGISVVAEGIETATQMNSLVDMGCKFGQGFLLGRPESIADLARGVGVAPAAVLERVAPVWPIALGSVSELDRLIAATSAINPRSTELGFDEIRRRLEALDARAFLIGPIAREARVEVGRRLALAATYAGETDMVVKWTMETSRLAESIELWGHSAEVLAMLASTPHDVPSDSAVRIEALTRAMQLRITKPMGADQSAGVDNGIGSAFSNFGLVDHAVEWWTDSVERHRSSKNAGVGMMCINLGEMHLRQLEGSGWLRNQGPDELTVAKVDQLLVLLDANEQAPAEVGAALLCRLELVRNDLQGAQAAVAGLDRVSSDIIPQFLVRGARAMLARAQGDHEACLEHVTALAGLLEGHPLLAQHDRYSQRLHGEALLAVGRIDEGVAKLRQAFTAQAAADANKLRALFEWIRLQVDVDVRFGELFRVLTPTEYPDGRSAASASSDG